VYVTGHGTVSIIDIEKEEVVKRLYTGDFNYAVTMTPDGKQAYVSSQGNVSVVDIATQEVLRTISLECRCLPKDIDFTLDGKQACVAVGQTILVIDTKKEEVIDTITVKGNFFDPYEVVISPNGNRIYLAGSSSGTTPDQILVIDAKTHSITKAIYTKLAPLGMAITSDGKELYITHCDHDDVSILDTQTYRVRHSIPVGRYPHQIIIAPSPE
jgi:YVTN family beta-propeller protein